MWKVSLALPGISPEKVDIDIVGRTLRVRGERTADAKAEPVIGEITYGRFEREFTLPEEIDAQHVQATYRHGMLELVLPAGRGGEAASDCRESGAGGQTAPCGVAAACIAPADASTGGPLGRSNWTFCAVSKGNGSTEVTMFGVGPSLGLFSLVTSTLAAAQAYAPVVTMSVTLPDGRTQELTAPDSGLATVSLKDGTAYGFRPTIQDSMPWNRIVVTIFRMATTTSPTQILGEVELKRGGPAADSKTNPSFKVAVPKVSPPATQTTSSKNEFVRFEMFGDT